MSDRHAILNSCGARLITAHEAYHSPPIVPPSQKTGREKRVKREERKKERKIRKVRNEEREKGMKERKEEKKGRNGGMEDEKERKKERNKERKEERIQEPYNGTSGIFFTLPYDSTWHNLPSHLLDRVMERGRLVR